MTASEKRTAVSLSSVYAMRMLGLFMILPVFSLYADHLEGNTPLLIGMAIGIYGLSQALLQIPFGLASDRLGRKPVIIFGLLLFVAGSVIAAMSESIYGVIIGRAIQGSGAIAAAVMALAADLSREEQRTKVMAMIGMSIGMAFALALLLGPLLNSWIGVPGIFWLTAVLASISIIIIKFAVPTAVHSRVHRDAQPVVDQLSSVMTDPQLLRLDAGIFILHVILTATFVVLPLALRDYSGLDAMHHWQVYLPALILSVAGMIPFIILAEKHRRMKQVFVGAIVVLAFSEIGLRLFYESLTGLFITIFVFFLAFNLLE
ncbi:MAG: MFS transporter, partial [Gammaproteobacteria bacterium]|nr:MFS transporter [Gammaproteobacteria bacterium]